MTHRHLKVIVYLDLFLLLLQFESRCIATMSMANRTEHLEMMVAHSGGSAENACHSIIDYKYNGLFGNNYFDYRRIIILLIYG